MVRGHAVTSVLATSVHLAIFRWAVDAKNLEKLPSTGPGLFAFFSGENHIVPIRQVFALGKSSVGGANRAFNKVSLGFGAFFSSGERTHIFGEVIIVALFPDNVVVVTTLPMLVKLGAFMELVFIKTEN